MAVYFEFTKMDGTKFAAQCPTVEAAIDQYVARWLGEIVEANPRMSGADFEYARDRMFAFAKAQTWRRVAKLSGHWFRT